MKVFRVGADSSCLIGLAQIDLFRLLKELFSEVYIPDAVYEEVVIKGKGEAGSEDTESAVKDGWIIKKPVKDEVAVKALTTILGQGEAEVIILCKELELNYALIDERTARNMAELMNVNTMGVLGVIDLAIEKGILIDKKKVIAHLKDLGFRISDILLKKMFPDSE
jgi:predicted nucleic acid-binding protein